VRTDEQEAPDGDSRNNAAIRRWKGQRVVRTGTRDAASGIETGFGEGRPFFKGTVVSAEANAVRKTSQGTQTGLVGRFIGDQREKFGRVLRDFGFPIRMARSAQRGSRPDFS